MDIKSTLEVTFGLHIISAHLCQMNKRYAHSRIYAFISSYRFLLSFKFLNMSCKVFYGLDWTCSLLGLCSSSEPDREIPESQTVLIQDVITYLIFYDFCAVWLQGAIIHTVYLTLSLLKQQCTGNVCANPGFLMYFNVTYLTWKGPENCQAMGQHQEFCKLFPFQRHWAWLWWQGAFMWHWRTGKPSALTLL